MKSLARLVLVGFLAIAPILGIGCADEKEPGAKPLSPPSEENAYVGAAACATCHADIASVVGASLHPGMVTVVNGQRPSAPPDLPDNPPEGKAWADIKYVLGGWGWKARFVTTDMQVVVGENAQYDVPTTQFGQGAWAAYSVDEPTPYDYACFRCHFTGPDQTNGALPEPGVQCEACHGMGKLHAQSPSVNNIVRDDSALACVRCHSRDAGLTRIIATGTFIDNHEQFEEKKLGGKLDGAHAGMKCTKCHDPHKGIRRGQVGGIVRDCKSPGCHPNQVVNHRGGGVSPNCVDCHMSRATLSARSVNKYQGDVRTHIFKIHEGVEGQAGMFEPVGISTYVKQGYGVTLDYACYSCHQDASGVGGGFSTKTLAELRAKAEEIHETDAVTGR
jgi:hypothetical protein